DMEFAGLIGVWTKRGGVWGAGVLGDDAHGAQLRPSAGIFKEDGPPARRHDDGFTEQADVAGTDEMVAPRDAVLAVLEPVLAAPAVAVELDDLLHKVPGPDRLALPLEGVHPRAPGPQIDPTRPRPRRTRER